MSKRLNALFTCKIVAIVVFLWKQGNGESMTVEYLETEGIVIFEEKNAPSKKYIQIATPYHGLIYTSVYGISKKRLDLQSSTNLLTRSHFQLKRGNKTYATLSEGKYLDHFPKLRSDLKRLMTAGELIQILRDSQLCDHPMPRLYALFLCFLKRLETSINPEALSYSFKLKRLIHDGLLDPRDTEHEDIKILAGSRDLGHIEAIEISTQLQEELDQLLLIHQEV